MATGVADATGGLGLGCSGAALGAGITTVATADSGAAGTAAGALATVSWAAGRVAVSGTAGAGVGWATTAALATGAAGKAEGSAFTLAEVVSGAGPAACRGQKAATATPTAATTATPRTSGIHLDGGLVGTLGDTGAAEADADGGGELRVTAAFAGAA